MNGATVDGLALFSRLMRHREAGTISACRIDQAGRNSAGHKQRSVIVLETSGRESLTFYLIDSGGFATDRDGLELYVDGLDGLDDFWSPADLEYLAGMAATRESVPSVVVTVAGADLPSYVCDWLEKLVNAEKREYAAAYCAHELCLGPAPADPGTGWAAKARSRADRLFREPFDRAVAGATI